MSKTTFIYEGSYSNPNGTFDHVNGVPHGSVSEQNATADQLINATWDPMLTALENAKRIRRAMNGEQVEPMSALGRAKEQRRTVNTAINEVRGQLSQVKDFWAEASTAAGVKLSF
jgi:hypothetical protein